MAHIIPPKTYYQVFAALMVLLVLTVAASLIEHDLLNTISAVTIAVTKAVLIVLFFMHVKYSSRMTQVLAVVGFIWLAIMLAIMFADYDSRSWPLFSTLASELFRLN
jgi:cytochrome c oxidase subunit IV